MIYGRHLRTVCGGFIGLLSTINMLPTWHATYARYIEMDQFPK